MSDILLVMVITAMACGVLGAPLVLRRLSLTADALSHSVLLGIVLAFCIVKNLDSIWLLVGASFFGLLMVYAVEFLSKRGFLRKDDALGFVFPIFFSLAVIIITKYFRNTHIDVDVVLMGNPLFSPFVRLWGMPRSLVIMGILFILNSLFLILTYRMMVLSSFDEKEAIMQGVPSSWLYGIFMSLTSLTCVAAFESVGAILVISFFVAPACSALLFSKHLYSSILGSLFFGVLYSCIGYFVGMSLNISISGLTAFVAMLGILGLGIVKRHCIKS